MTTATLLKENTFQWGWLTGSEVQSVIAVLGSTVARGTQADVVMEKSRVLHLDKHAT